jgi:hypothetical protein
MNSRLKQIGFSQRIRVEWLEETAQLVMAGYDQKTINEALQSMLKDQVSIGGTAQRGNREKIITILLKVWHKAPSELESLRSRGIEMLERLPQRMQIGLHWGMVTAVYPFWKAVASHTGRLFNLQGTAVASHIQRRVREQYGERETVSRAARRVIRSFADWAVISDTKTKGIYTKGKTIDIDLPEHIAWIIEALLYASEPGTYQIETLFNSPSLFPFKLSAISPEKLQNHSKNIEVLRLGLSDNMVKLRA